MHISGSGPQPQPQAAGQQGGGGAGFAPATAALLGASDSLECRRFDVAGLGVDIFQDLKGSNALRPLDDDSVWADLGGRSGREAGAPILTGEDLSRVGLVVWQAGFVLADLLLRRPPFGSWHGVQVLDLGCGTGLVGILLALAGAEVTLSDQPHITPLAEANVKANLTPGLHRARVVPYVWGQGEAAAACLPPLPAGQQTHGGPEPAAVVFAAHASAAAAAPAAACFRSASSASDVAQMEQQAVPPPLATAGGIDRGGAAAGAAQESAPQGPCFDVITAADVVYQPECYAELAATLRALAAPHALVFVAFKNRGLQEDSLLAQLEERGFALSEVPQTQLAAEYQGGSYRVVRATRFE